MALLTLTKDSPYTPEGSNIPHKVLIVDDEPGIRECLTEVLRGEGLDPLEAPSGTQAIDIFERERPAGILLDLVMPGMDGVETMEKLKKLDPDIPIIIITGHGDISPAVDAIKRGPMSSCSNP